MTAAKTIIVKIFQFNVNVRSVTKSAAEWKRKKVLAAVSQPKKSRNNNKRPAAAHRIAASAKKHKNLGIFILIHVDIPK